MKKILSILLFVGFASLPAFAQIYELTDKNGNRVFSDSPQAGADAREVKGGADKIFRSGAGSAPHKDNSNSGPPNSSSEEKRKRSYGDVNVVMYTTSWCGYCKQARDYIFMLGANLVEYDIEKDKDRKAEMVRKSGGGISVPLIDIEGTIIRGFNQNAIRAALDAKSGQ